MRNLPGIPRDITMKTYKFASILSALVALASTPAYAVSYYFSPTGLDTNNCQSPTTACKDINKVNAYDLNAGDIVNLEEGGVFTGNIVLTSQDSGASGSPVI